MRKTREERKFERSQKASRAANARWAQYHAALVDLPIYEQPRLADEYEIIVRNLITGKAHTLMLHPGPRLDNFSVDLDGSPWRVGSFSSIMTTLRKSLVKSKPGKII